MKQVAMRLEADTLAMLSEIEARPTSAAQIILEVFMWLKRATHHELKGRFTREEILALAESHKSIAPAWQIMCNTSVLVAHTEDAERYQYTISSHGANPKTLLEKLRQLTTAQATILQLELWAFWYRPEKKPDLQLLVDSFL